VQFSDKKLLIFDFDGTLIDSVPDLASALNAMLRTLGREPFSIETIREWVGNGAQTLVSRALCGSRDFDEAALAQEPLAEALDIFLEYYEKNPAKDTLLYDGVKETLQELHSRGYILSIVTNKPYKFIVPILEALEIKDLFALYIGADSLEHKKPRPEPLLHICKELGCSVEASLMIGDSKNDILAAKAAKMDSVAVSYGYNYGEDIRAYEPDVVIKHFSDLKQVVS
jgi:phosphoglycolate phosphatase